MCLGPIPSSTVDSNHGRELKQTNLLSENIIKSGQNIVCEIFEGMRDQKQAELEWAFTVGRDL